MDIDKLEAGRELDALVWLALNGKAGEMIDQGVFGCRYVDGDVQPHAGYPMGHISPPNYSTDDGPSWGMIDKLIDEGYCPALLYDDNGHWALSLEGAQNVPIGPDPQDIATSFFVSADMWCDTPQLAICRAVLKVYNEPKN